MPVRPSRGRVGLSGVDGAGGSGTKLSGVRSSHGSSCMTMFSLGAAPVERRVERGQIEVRQAGADWMDRGAVQGRNMGWLRHWGRW